MENKDRISMIMGEMDRLFVEFVNVTNNLDLDYNDESSQVFDVVAELESLFCELKDLIEK